MKYALISALCLTLPVISCSDTSGGSDDSGGGGTFAATGGASAGGATGASGAGATAAGGNGPASGGASGTSTGAGGSAASSGTMGVGGTVSAGGIAGASGGGGSGGTAGGGAGVGGGGTSGAAGGGGTSGASGAGGSMSATGPCDILGGASTPCVAAHSTVRALYAAYGGNLYQVRRASDKATKDVGLLGPGGFADSAVQDAFCMGTACTISIIYDQSPKGNHLKVAPGGGAVRTGDKEVNAARSKLNVGGHSVYAAYFEGGMGYRNNATSGIATGDQAQGEYMVTSGKHYNNQCCFDYGNAETSNNDDGNGTMEAIYFGNCTGWGKGSGNGPWVMADLENGLFGGQSFTANNNNTPLTYDYVTAMIKGKPGGFAIKGGDATSGTLKTMYDGGRPANGYNPMRKQGAIILGIGGDNSNGSTGTFFEGCMTSGYPSDATDAAVQANIVAAGYGR